MQKGMTIMAKSDRFYFENFVAAADLCCRAAAYLEDCIETVVMKNT